MTITNNNELLRSVIAALPDIAFIITESGKYADIFGGEESTYYHNGKVLIGKTLQDVLPEEKAQWFLNKIQEVLEKNELTIIEYQLSADDVNCVDNVSGPDGVLWFEGRVKPLPIEHYGERAVIWVARNITLNHVLLSNLQQLTELDPLTGVANRRKLLSMLKDKYDEFMRYQNVSSFLLVDIDHFKDINTELGHLGGDRAIVHVMSILKKMIRKSDAIGRLGGDEFGIIIPETSSDNAALFAQRIREEVQNAPFVTEHGKVYNITISIGISHFLLTDTIPQDVICRADKAMYKTKNSGRNNISVYHTMD